MALSALCRQNLFVPCELVGGGHLGFGQGNILEPYSQDILSLRSRPIIAIQEGLCTNVCQAVSQYPRLAVVAENLVEGFDVRIDGSLQSRVGGVIFGRIPEEVFTTKRVVLVIPVGLGRGGRHRGYLSRSLAGVRCRIGGVYRID